MTASETVQSLHATHAPPTLCKGEERSAVKASGRSASNDSPRGHLARHRGAGAGVSALANAPSRRGGTCRTDFSKSRER
eukprot:4772335-Pyramimonas_sp.AAC.1